MYVAGGRSHWGNQFGALEIYDPVANAWSTGAPLPITVEDPGSATIGGKFYVIGGFNFANNIMTGALQIYDPLTDAWTAGAPMPTPRSGAMIGVLNGKLVAVGGHDGTSHVTTVEIYDPASDSWTSGTSAPETLLGGAVGVVNSQLFIAGGYGHPAAFPLQATLHVYTPQPDISLRMYAGITLIGSVGATYRVDYRTNLTTTNWSTLTNLVLPASPHLVIDTDSPNAPMRFYRAVLVP